MEGGVEEEEEGKGVREDGEEGEGTGRGPFLT